MTTCSTGPCWTASTYNSTNFDPQDTTFFNNLYIVGGADPTNGNTVIQYSSDGFYWTRLDIGYFAGGGLIGGFASGNGLLLGMISAERNIVSSDGINWTSELHWPPASGSQALAFGAGVFAYTFNNGLNDRGVAYSPNGQTGTWTKTQSNNVSYFDTSRIYAGGLWVATGQNGFSYTSDIAIAPTTVEIPSGSNTGYPTDLAYGNGVFVANSIVSRNIFYSTNGTSWTFLADALPPLQGFAPWRGIIYSQGYFICAAQDTNILAISSDGIIWTLTTSDHWFDSVYQGDANKLGFPIMTADGYGRYLAASVLNNKAQIGVCPCPTPVIYKDCWVSLSNVAVSNVSVSKNISSGDPYWSDVTWLITGNGTLGTNTVVDSGPNNQVFTTEWGTWTYTNTKNKFYPTSLIGTETGALSTVIPSSGINKSWTVELWFYATTAAFAGSGGGMSILANTNAEWILGTVGPANGGNNQLNLSNGPLGAGYAASPSGIPADQWVYLAMTFEDITGAPGHSGVLRTFINGILVASYGESISFSGIDWKGKVWIGPNSPPFFTENNYYFADYRFTRGVARYTSSFTPPTGPLPLF